MTLIALIFSLSLTGNGQANTPHGVLVWADLSGATPVIEAYGERTYFQSDVTTAPGSHQLWTFYNCRQREMGRTRVWDPRWVGGGHTSVAPDGTPGPRVAGYLGDGPLEGEAIAPHGAAYFTISLDDSDRHPDGEILGPFAMPNDVFACHAPPDTDFSPNSKGD